MTLKTIASSLVMASLLAVNFGIANNTQAYSTGTLVKSSTYSAVYYIASNGNRYVFPNEMTYKTWYPDFSGVQTISDADMAAIAIGGNVTFRPGSKLIKIGYSSTVYAVSKGGVLRGILNEVTAGCIYGQGWNSEIYVIGDAFFSNYTIGSGISACDQYNRTSEYTTTTTINQNLGL